MEIYCNLKTLHGSTFAKFHRCVLEKSRENNLTTSSWFDRSILCKSKGNVTENFGIV